MLGRASVQMGRREQRKKKEKPRNGNTKEGYIHVKSERNKYNKLSVRQVSAFLLKINNMSERKTFSSSLLYHDSSQIKLHMYFSRNTADLLPFI